MGERWDNLKEEIYWPIAQAQHWYGDPDNRFATWAIVITTAVLALFVYFPAFFGGRAVLNALNEKTMLTVVSGNPCLTDKGLVKEWAPATCYDSGHKHVVVPTAAEPQTPQTIRNNDATISSPNDVAYNPPCKKDGLPGCSDQIYSKRLVEGEIYTVEFNGDERTESDGHLQPDYTEVKFLALQDDQVAPDPEKFCGNVLDHFTPGKKFRMVINESKQSDYNGCYMIDVTVLTFGGDKYVSRHRK